MSSYHNELQAPGLKGLLFAGYDTVVTRAALRRSARLTVAVDGARPRGAAAGRRAAPPPGRVRAVPNGVDIETFRPGGEPELRAALGIPADATVAAFCAKLDAAHLTKRLDLAIEATARVPGLTLLVIGGGPLQERYEAQAAEAGVPAASCSPATSVTTTVARHLRAADLLVMPSTLESFGIVQLEAMASGLPVVDLRPAGRARREPRRRARRPRRPGRPSTTSCAALRAMRGRRPRGPAPDGRARHARTSPSTTPGRAVPSCSRPSTGRCA